MFEDQLSPMDTTGFGDGIKILSYKELIILGENFSKKDADVPRPQDTAIIMYTSGSTGIYKSTVDHNLAMIWLPFLLYIGPPKGVALSHKNIVNELYAATDNVGAQANDMYLAHLPLAHIYELVAESWFCLACGVPIGYSTPYTLTDRSTKIKQGHQGDVSVLQPTIMVQFRGVFNVLYEFFPRFDVQNAFPLLQVTVPLVLDRIYKGIKEKIETESPVKKAIFNLALKYKIRWMQRGYDTPILNAQVLYKMRLHLRTLFCEIV